MLDGVPLVLVESAEALKAVVESLANEPVLGIDTESDSFHHYQEKVCLIQISDANQDIIIDTLAVPDLTPLAPVLANPNQVKVLHGADYDIVCLKRDHDLQIRGLWDTMVAARFLGVEKVGLGDLVDEMFGISLDKRLQRHDWASRPLLSEHLEYARSDTHWLPALREVQTRRLVHTGWLVAVEEECRVLEGREWAGRREVASDWLRIRGAALLPEEGKRVLRKIAAYRQAQARRMDRPVFRVIPDPVLLRVAQVLPRTEEDLADIVRGRSPLFRQHGRAMVQGVLDGLADDTPLESARPAIASPRPKGPVRASRYAPQISEAVRRWRTDKTTVDHVSAVRLISNSVIRELSWHAPTTVEQLALVPDMRQWQVKLYGEELVEIVQSAMCVVDNPEGRASRRKKKRRVET